MQIHFIPNLKVLYHLFTKDRLMFVIFKTISNLKSMYLKLIYNSSAGRSKISS